MNISAANLGVLIAGGAIMLFLGLAIGAIILRAACNLYNKIVGRDAVPEPGFGKAMGIILVTGLINWALSFAIGIAFSVMLRNANIPAQALAGVLQLIALPVALVIQASMLTALLPTTLGRALIIIVLEFLIVLLIVAVVAGIFFGMAIALR